MAQLQTHQGPCPAKDRKIKLASVPHEHCGIRTFPSEPGFTSRSHLLCSCDHSKMFKKMSETDSIERARVDQPGSRTHDDISYMKWRAWGGLRIDNSPEVNARPDRPLSYLDLSSH